MSALKRHSYSTEEKRKRKETNNRNSNKRSKANEKAKSKITWRRQVSDPLGKGNGSTHPWQTMLKQRAQTTNPKPENDKELPLHTCKLPQNQCNSPWTNACKPHCQNKATASALLWPVRPVNHTSQTGVLDRPTLGTHTGQPGVPHRTGRYHLGNCPSSKLARNHLETF
jgi:hypothetical protein